MINHYLIYVLFLMKKKLKKEHLDMWRDNRFDLFI